MAEELLETIVKQNEVIISLLSRIAFTPEKVREIVTSNKQNPESYIVGYNALDGAHSITEIAQIIGVSQPTLSTIIPQWEEIGIIYPVESKGRKGGKFYKRLFEI